MTEQTPDRFRMDHLVNATIDICMGWGRPFRNTDVRRLALKSLPGISDKDRVVLDRSVHRRIQTYRINGLIRRLAPSKQWEAAEIPIQLSEASTETLEGIPESAPVRSEDYLPPSFVPEHISETLEKLPILPGPPAPMVPPSATPPIIVIISGHIPDVLAQLGVRLT